MSEISKVYLVGAGSGDPELLTLKGLRVLQDADVVIYDRLANPILLYLTKACAQLINVGKAPKHHQKTQAEIEQLMISAYKNGQIVVRLKGGDPAIFGRVGEEVLALKKSGIPYEVVPGVTAASAATSYADIFITHRKIAERVLIMTPRQTLQDLSETDFPKILLDTTVVIYMGVSSLPELAHLLTIQGVSGDIPIALIENGTRGYQRTLITHLSVLLADLAKTAIQNPALIVIGQTVGLRSDVSESWFEALPKFGQRILLVSTLQPSLDDLTSLTSQGADVWAVIVGSARQTRFDALDAENLQQPFSQVIYQNGATELELEKLKKELIKDDA
ncbi:uroporphyrinogen-III C-methyltransferase [Pseudolactococcus insecticola]|uniref:uroporphyrinogen-III C-methyltransferase n=1 Tax=Pseudolactococcus insecticola TaxID=2709158 RepID=A0A6A0B811_9LACT|nr:uroporphyrinogen-III C-methyltransferase [Lactococcus insecticola]GFH39927.1 hypothetical protein Hs20B_03250 [Lactococcus insecticola]